MFHEIDLLRNKIVSTAVIHHYVVWQINQHHHTLKDSAFFLLSFASDLFQVCQMKMMYLIDIKIFVPWTKIEW